MSRRSIGVFVYGALALSLALALVAANQNRVGAAGVQATIDPHQPAWANKAGGKETRTRLSPEFGKLPIGFEMNSGQTDPSVQFVARGMAYTLYLSHANALVRFHGPAVRGAANHVAASSREALEIELTGSNPNAPARGEGLLPGKSNYFIGNDPARWHIGIPTYSRVRYGDVYPGVDVVYYGNQHGRLEHDFEIAPGADPRRIAIDLHNERAVAGNDGAIVLGSGREHLVLQKPVAYQEIGGQRKSVDAAYIFGDGRLGFKLGSYDHHAPLIIDPVLEYTAMFGDMSGSAVTGIAVDSAGNTYVTGNTYGNNFPLVNNYQNPWLNESGDYIAFVSKINAAGTAFVYSNVFASSSYQFGTLSNGIAVDSAGRAYITGSTGAILPVMNAYQPNAGGAVDAYLTVFSAAGDSLAYSTYLGGPGYEYANAIALDAADNAYITGYITYDDGSHFPQLHSVETTGNTFVSKFNSSGSLVYSSVFGSASSGNIPTTSPLTLAVDGSGAAYVAGFTVTSGIPVVSPAFQSSCSSNCGFVSKLSAGGNSFDYSTYFPRTVNVVAVDSDGGAYVAGNTGAGFPAHKTGFQKTYGGGASDGYVAKLNASGSALVWSTYLGGSGADTITGMAVDQHRTVYVTGSTNSPNFPWRAPVQTVNPSNSPFYFPFVTTLSGSLGSIEYYSTDYGLGSTGPLFGTIAVDKALNAYVANTALGGYDMEPTPGALSDYSYDVISVAVTKFVIEDDISLTQNALPSPVASRSNLTYTLAVKSNGPDYGYNVRLSDALPAGTTFVNVDAGGGSCTAPAVGGTGNLNCDLAQLNAGSTWTVKLTVHVTAPAGTTLSNLAAALSNMQDFNTANNSATLATTVD